jgi:transcriptional regulator with XRE-family HTH domain
MNSLAGVGALLRQAREGSRLSQLALALQAEVSPRHLSCVETGRAQPSVALLMKLARCLQLPLRTRNQWLLAAGYAPRYAEPSLDAPAMRHVLQALSQVLQAHEPYPAMLLNTRYEVLRANRSAQALVALLPAFLQGPPLNLLRASLHPQGFAAVTCNFEAWAQHLLEALDQQASQGSADAQALKAEIDAYPNVRALRQGARPADEGQGVVLGCELMLNGQRLSLFSTLTALATPQAVTAQELRLELFYPADAATAETLAALAAAALAPAESALAPAESALTPTEPAPARAQRRPHVAKRAA